MNDSGSMPFSLMLFTDVLDKSILITSTNGKTIGQSDLFVYIMQFIQEKDNFKVFLSDKITILSN